MAKMKPAVDSWRKPLFDNLLRGIRLRSSVYFRPEFRARRLVTFCSWDYVRNPIDSDFFEPHDPRAFAA